MARSVILALVLATTLIATQATRAPAQAAAQAPAIVSSYAGLAQLADVEDQFLALLNAERSALELDPLQPYFDLEDDAAVHTTEMIATGDIYHTTDLAAVATGWQALGENVGYGPTVEKLHTAFMNSPHHRDNIVGDYDQVGIAADRNDHEVIFVTFIFMRSITPPIPDSHAPLGPESLGPAAELAGALWLGVR